MAGRKMIDGDKKNKYSYLRSQQILDDLKESRGYWIWKEEALDCAVWRIR
jgi:hypothetical protein